MSEIIRTKSFSVLMNEIEHWSQIYDISFQFWGKGNNNVDIEKSGVNLWSAGGYETAKGALMATLEYINRINPKT